MRPSTARMLTVPGAQRYPPAAARVFPVHHYLDLSLCDNSRQSVTGESRAGFVSRLNEFRSGITNCASPCCFRAAGHVLVVAELGPLVAGR